MQKTTLLNFELGLPPHRAASVTVGILLSRACSSARNDLVVLHRGARKGARPRFQSPRGAEAPGAASDVLGGTLIHHATRFLLTANAQLLWAYTS